jgi:hypothetical protein
MTGPHLTNDRARLAPRAAFSLARRQTPDPSRPLKCPLVTVPGLRPEFAHRTQSPETRHIDRHRRSHTSVISPGIPPCVYGGGSVWDFQTEGGDNGELAE